MLIYLTFKPHFYQNDSISSRFLSFWQTSFKQNLILIHFFMHKMGHLKRHFDTFNVKFINFICFLHMNALSLHGIPRIY